MLVSVFLFFHFADGVQFNASLTSMTLTLCSFSLRQLEMAVSMEMKTFKEEWEKALDDLEAESALLLVCLFLPFWVFSYTLHNVLYFGTKPIFYFTKSKEKQIDKNTLQGLAHTHQKPALKPRLEYYIQPLTANFKLLITHEHDASFRPLFLSFFKICFYGHLYFWNICSGDMAWQPPY